MYRIWTYLKFFLSSTNQHGVHSPFVYAYLTKCLYKRTTYSGNRVFKVLIKSIPYFKVRSVHLKTDRHDLERQLFKAYPSIEFSQTPADLIFVDRLHLLQCKPRLLQDQCHAQSMILLEDIHRNGETSAVWKSLCEKAWVTVSIDFYFGGILFVRSEQEKQDFKIRI